MRVYWRPRGGAFGASLPWFIALPAFLLWAFFMAGWWLLFGSVLLVNAIFIRIRREVWRRQIKAMLRRPTSAQPVPRRVR